MSLDKSENYELLKYRDFISINLSYGMKEEDAIINEYYLQNNNRKFIDNLMIIEINMDLLEKNWYDLKEKEKNNNEEYKFFLTDEEDAEKLLNTDRYIARKEGHAEGLEEGRIEGIEHNKKKNALNLYTNGASKELIIKSLEITEEQLNEYIYNKYNF